MNEKFRDFLKESFHLLPLSFQENFRKRTFDKWVKRGKPIPPPQVVKLFAIRRLQQEFKCSTFIETGTYKGDMLFALKNDFKELISVELSDFYYKNAVEKFRHNSNVKLFFGDSGEIMPKIIAGLNEPALFWLDGHFSSGNTAKGELDCPIYGELLGIFLSPYPHILLIDDARCFNGTNDYPTIQDLKSFIETHKPGCYFEVKDDMITVILPKP